MTANFTPTTKRPYFRKFLSKKGLSEICLHVLCWLLFIGYELGYLFWSGIRLEAARVFICFYLINIVYFYLLVYFLRVTFRPPRRFQLQGLAKLVGLFLAFLTLRLVADHILVPQISFKVQLYRYLPADFFRNVYFTMLATFYWAASSIQQARAEKAEAEQKRLSIENHFAAARNAYLRQQLSPHLLFNSLNLIYSRVFRQSAETGNYVMLLSDIMRYSLQEGDAEGKVALASELEQIRHLAAINRARYDEPIRFELSVSGDPGDLRIIPLVLFTLTENVFKHGDLESASGPAAVTINLENPATLRYQSRNPKKAGAPGMPRSGTGLQNLRTRLSYAYPGSHQLSVSEDEQTFELNLTLQL